MTEKETLNLLNILIGKRYDKENYNCWHFINEIHPNTPKINEIITLKSALELMKKEYNQLVQVQDYEQLSIVFLGTKENQYFHAGIYYDTGFTKMIIHNNTDGVQAEELKKITVQYPFQKIYKCK